MNFRSLLSEVARRYPSGRKFTSREVARSLGLSGKSASNSLRRLHSMGFLNRQRRSRSYSVSLLTILRAYRKRRRGRLPPLLSHKKGFEYVYSLSRQGLSYVNWMKHGKLFEDIQHLSLQSTVMKALPEPLRNEIATMSLIRAGYKYRGPTRQLRLLENPAAPMFAMAARIEEQGRRNKEDQLELLKAWVGERRRAMQAERYFLEFALLFGLLYVAGIVRIDFDSYDKVMSDLAIKMPSFTPVQAWLLAKGKP